MAIFILVAIGLGIWTKGRREKRKHSLYVKINCTHVDSVWNYLIQKAESNPIEFSQDLVNKVEELDRKELKDSADKLIGYMVNYQEKNPDPNFLVNFYMMQKKLAFMHNEMEQYDYWDKKRTAFESFASVNNKLSNSIITWAYLFENEQFDSCINLLEQALALSKAHNDTFYKSSIYINLGASYYETKMFDKASRSFYEALLTENLSDIHKKILSINLMIFLNREEKWNEIIQIYNRYKSQLNSKIAGEELFELTNLLLASAYYHLNPKDNQYKTYLKSAEINGINEQNQEFYLRTQARILYDKGDSDSLALLYNRFKEVFHKNLPYTIELHFKNLLYLNQQGKIVYDIGSLQKDIKSLSISNVYASYYYAKLIEAYYLSKKQNAKANYWDEEAKRYATLYQKRFIQVSKTNMQMAIENAQMQLNIRRKKFDIELNNLRNRQLLTASFSILVIGALLIMVYIRAKTIQERKWKMLKIQNEISTNSFEIAQGNYENDREIIFKSQALFQKLKSILENIESSVHKNHPSVLKCRGDIQNLLQFKYIEKDIENHINSNIYSQYDYLKIRYKTLSNIGNNAFKIIVHSVLNNEPKDIGHLLNLNVQYVRNVRSKVKKEIALEVPNFSDWPDLISQ